LLRLVLVHPLLPQRKIPGIHLHGTQGDHSAIHQKAHIVALQGAHEPRAKILPSLGDGSCLPAVILASCKKIECCPRAGSPDWTGLPGYGGLKYRDAKSLAIALQWDALNIVLKNTPHLCPMND
jgi:hypothetical protein